MNLRELRRSHALMILLVFALCLTNLLFAERTMLSLGFGTDGTNYGAVARDVYGSLFVRGTNRYYLQRVMPSVLVHYGLRLFGVPTDPPHVVLGFQWLNLLLLVGSAALWKPISDLLELDLRARWLGFIGLFVNYAIVKHAYYFPVFTDVAAFALGMAYLYLFLAGRQTTLLALVILGAFSWPIAGVSGAALLLFPRGRVGAPDESYSRWSLIAGASIAGILLLGFVYMYYVRHLRKVGQGPTIPPIDSLVPLSMVISFAYTLAGFHGLLRGIGPAYVRRALAALRLRDAIYAVLALVVPILVVRMLASGAEPALAARGFLRFIVYPAHGRPFVNFISHVVWWGPVLWLVFLRWRELGRFVQRLGPGLVAFMCLAFLVAETPESRQSSLAFPFFIAFGAAAVQRELTVGLNWVLAISGLALSKFWLTINTPEALAFVASGRPGPSDAESAWQYRNYYLSIGLWMPNRWLLVHGVIVIALGLGIWMILAKQTRRAEPVAI